MSITKIAVTGGPCAGKTTALESIRKAFSEMGYRVLFIAETATELISSGVTPSNCSSPAHYQLCQMKLQIAKEKVYDLAASSMDHDKILIVCDRGLPDNRAYMNDEDFQMCLKETGLTEEEIYKEYKGAFHLVTAAKGAEDYYTTENNTARTETPREAADLDDRVIEAWKNHPNLIIIDNSTDFDTKMNRLIKEIAGCLGEEAGISG